MSAIMRIEGINLEKLITDASKKGIILREICREGERAVSVKIRAWEIHAMRALCAQQGWAVEETHVGWRLRLARFFCARKLLPAGMMLGALMVWLSSQMVLSIRIDHAQENIAEVRRYLMQAGVRPGKWKASLSTDELREGLSLALPGLAFAAIRYEGSTLVVDCRSAVMGEETSVPGAGMDVVAAKSGVVTHISAVSGTPQVEVGQAVHRGQVLILGQERTEKGGFRAVQAQGQVMARVWVVGEARAALYETQTAETGRTRRRVTLRTPWHSRVVKDAQPFDSQDAEKRTQAVVGLYLPLVRDIEIMAETAVTRIPRRETDAMSIAQGAAQEIAKKQCAYGARILDKTVDYSKIDNEFVYATVVLETEESIAGRMNGQSIAD